MSPASLNPIWVGEYLTNLFKQTGPLFVTLIFFYTIQSHNFGVKIKGKLIEWYDFFEKNPNDKENKSIFLLINKLKKVTGYSLSWLGEFSKISKSFLDNERKQFRINEAKTSFINALSIYGIYSEKLRYDIENNVLFNEDPDQAIKELTQKLKEDFPGKNEFIPLLLYFIYLERRNDPQKNVYLDKIVNKNTLAKEFFLELLSQKLNLKVNDQWLEETKPWILENSLIICKSDFHLENFLVKCNEIANEIYSMLVKFKEITRKYGLTFESEALRGSELPDIYNLDKLRELLISIVSESNHIPQSPVDTIIQLESTSSTSQSKMTHLKLHVEDLREFFEFLVENEILISQIEFEDFVVIFEELIIFSLEKLQLNCNTLSSYINYHRGAITSLEILRVPTVSTKRISTKRIKSFLKVTDLGYRPRQLSVLTDLTFDLIDWNKIGIKFELVNPDKSLESQQREFSTLLVVLIVNFFRGEISSISVTEINKQCLDYPNLDLQLFNYVKSIEQNPNPNLVELIEDAFKGVLENQKDPSLTLFKDKLSMGRLPSYKELAKERVNDALQVIKQSKILGEQSQKQDKLIQVFRKFMDFEVKSYEINNLLKGGVVEAYLLTVSTEGTALSKMGSGKLDKFAKFLDGYSKITNNHLLESKSFLMVRSAGRAARIGLLPPKMSFEDFAAYFNDALNAFFANEKSPISDVFLSRIFASEGSFKNLSSNSSQEATHLKVIREIISKDLEAEYVISYLSAIRPEKKPTIDTVKDLLSKVVNSNYGQFYGFGEKTFKRMELKKALIDAIEHDIMIHYKVDSFLDGCLKLYSLILGENAKKERTTLTRIISNQLISYSKDIKIDYVSNKIADNFLETAEIMQEVFK